MTDAPSLADITARLAALAGPDPFACWEAFGTPLADEGGTPHRYSAPSPTPGVVWLDLRVGETGSIVVVRIAPDRQEAWAQQVVRLGPLLGFDVVLPPLLPENWIPRWSETREVEGATLTFGYEGERERPRLATVSRIW